MHHLKFCFPYFIGSIASDLQNSCLPLTEILCFFLFLELVSKWCGGSGQLLIWQMIVVLFTLNSMDGEVVEIFQTLQIKDAEQFCYLMFLPSSAQAPVQLN